MLLEITGSIKSFCLAYLYRIYQDFKLRFFLMINEFIRIHQIRSNQIDVLKKANKSLEFRFSTHYQHQKTQGYGN